MSNSDHRPGYGQSRGYSYDFAVKTASLEIPVERVQTVQVKTKPKKADTPTSITFDTDLSVIEESYSNRVEDFPKGLVVSASVGKSTLYGSVHKEAAMQAALDSAFADLFPEFQVRTPVPDGIRINGVLQHAPTWKRYVFTIRLSEEDLPASDLMPHYTVATSFAEGIDIISKSGIEPWSGLADLPQYFEDLKFSQVFPTDSGIALIYASSRKNPVFPSKERDALNLLFPGNAIEMSLIHENKIV